MCSLVEITVYVKLEPLLTMPCWRPSVCCNRGSSGLYPCTNPCSMGHRPDRNWNGRRGVPYMETFDLWKQAHQQKKRMRPATNAWVEVSFSVMVRTCFWQLAQKISIGSRPNWRNKHNHSSSLHTNVNITLGWKNFDCLQLTLHLLPSSVLVHPAWVKLFPQFSAD